MCLQPLLELRYRTKQLKKTAPHYHGADSILKWMLVTCFGYTGYKNAKFGRIEVHERITSGSRDILIRSKDIAEEEGATVLHGIVDCLWLQGPGREHLKARIDKETQLLTELESYDWLVFLPMPDGFGAYNRYYGRLNDGSVKIRGIASRRGDTPEYISQAQTRMLDLLGTASSRSGINEISSAVRELYRELRDGLRTANPQEMAIHRQVSQARLFPELSRGIGSQGMQGRRHPGLAGDGNRVCCPGCREMGRRPFMGGDRVRCDLLPGAARPGMA